MFQRFQSCEPNLANAGTLWSKDEETRLLNEIAMHMNIKDIAVLHKRTEGGIMKRLRDIACIKIDQNIPIEQVSNETSLTIEQISDALHQRKSKKTTPSLQPTIPSSHPTNTNISVSIDTTELSSIKEHLRSLDEKMGKILELMMMKNEK